MNKAIFLDRDGTINVEKDYLYKIEEFELIPNVINGLRMLQNSGYLLIIITNQSGIARGYYSENDYEKLTAWMLDMFEKEGVRIAGVYYCPHHPKAKIEQYRIKCKCRKPKLELFLRAVEDFNLDLDKSFAIGDKIRDCEICKESGCQGYLISNNEDSNLIEAVKNGEYNRVKYAKDLYTAAIEILSK